MNHSIIYKIGQQVVYTALTVLISWLTLLVITNWGATDLFNPNVSHKWLNITRISLFLATVFGGLDLWFGWTDKIRDNFQRKSLRD